MVWEKGCTGRSQLTTEERTRVRTLYFDGQFKIAKIQQITGYTRSQIRYTIAAEDAAVKPRSGRPTILSQAEEDELLGFICASKENRRMSFLQLSQSLFQKRFGMWAIKNTLYRLGFRRRVARKKPPISEINRQKRLQWALEHKDWPEEKWMQILWTDETWVTGGSHCKQFVTRRNHEEWDPTCIIEKYQRKGGWMFWGCFSGATGKGPGLFWEKDWGTITKESYQAHTVPLIDGWIRLCRQEDGERLLLMQDGAPSHTAASTRQDFEERGIEVIFWPPFSPDLNPIENCWNWMKDWIQDCYGLDEKPSYDRLRAYVKQAWEALPEDFLKSLLASMPRRCEAVIEANGMHTKY